MNTQYQTLRRAAFLSLLVALGLPAVVAAQPPAELREIVVHDRERGELSPGTQAPTPEQLMTAIESNTAPTTLVALLEYGERVECHACVPLLQRAVLEHRDPEVRRISAWWLRHRIFALAPIMAQMQDVLASDASATRRARAAMALGEFMDPAAFTPLRDAAMGDGDSGVRAAAVTALGRLNHSGRGLGRRDPDALGAPARDLPRGGGGAGAAGHARDRHQRAGASGGGVGPRSHRRRERAGCASRGRDGRELLAGPERDRGRARDALSALAESTYERAGGSDERRGPRSLADSEARTCAVDVDVDVRARVNGDESRLRDDRHARRWSRRLRDPRLSRSRTSREER